MSKKCHLKILSRSCFKPSCFLGFKHKSIFSDGIKDEKDRDFVGKVRNLIDSIDWCETEIIKSEKNKGLADSIVHGVNYFLERHTRIIVLEDDCLPSDDFIVFMGKCFDKYETNEKVMNLTGYSLPINIPDDYPCDIYFSYRSSSWEGVLGSGL